jgi:uncharacterized protein
MFTLKLMNNIKGLESIFGKNKNIVIGAIHFPPLSGYADSPGIEIALNNALADLRAFESGGVDGVIIENNYDIPHKAFVNREVSDDLLYLSKKLFQTATIPIGISVLWNDFKTALYISKKVGLKFVRIPVFVDTVRTSYGVMEAQADNIKLFQKEIKAENIALFTDIHVKHSEILSTYTIPESAKLSIEKGSDALIITGKWTGEMPDLAEIKQIRKSVNDFPIICGSGVNVNNITQLFRYSNGAIISTSLKEGDMNKEETNTKAYNQRIDEKKVKELMNKLK